MEWTIRLEAKTGWGEVETVEVVSIARPVLAATADDVGLSLAEAKSLLTRLLPHLSAGERPATAAAADPVWYRRCRGAAI